MATDAAEDGIPRRDETGRIHDPIPREVPEEWDEHNISEALNEVDQSIENRLNKGKDEGGLDHKHDKRLKKEKEWQQKLENRLRKLRQQKLSMSAVEQASWYDLYWHYVNPFISHHAVDAGDQALQWGTRGGQILFVVGTAGAAAEIAAPGVVVASGKAVADAGVAVGAAASGAAGKSLPAPGAP